MEKTDEISLRHAEPRLPVNTQTERSHREVDLEFRREVWAGNRGLGAISTETVMEARGENHDHQGGGQVVYPRSHIMEVTLEPCAGSKSDLIPSFQGNLATT